MRLALSAYVTADIHVCPINFSPMQADVCHAYQVLHAHGVPDDHIVVMMYDDIANNAE